MRKVIMKLTLPFRKKFKMVNCSDGIGYAHKGLYNCSIVETVVEGYDDNGNEIGIRGYKSECLAINPLRDDIRYVEYISVDKPGDKFLYNDVQRKHRSL